MLPLSALLTIALACGIAAGAARETSPSLALALTMSAAWAGALLAYLRGHVRLQLAAVFLLIAAAGWTAGAHAVDRAQQSPLRRLFDERGGEEPLIVEGRLREDAVAGEAGVVLRIDVERVSVLDAGIVGGFELAAGGVAVGVGGTPQADSVASWIAGRTIRAPVLLRRPARYLNRGVPDQERALARRGVSLVGTIKSAQLVEIVAHGAWWEEAAATVRKQTRAALHRHVGASAAQSAAIANAILIGDRSGLATELERRLQEAGTYHVIAISGGNIAILAATLLGAMRAFGVRGRAAALVAMATLAAYALIAAGGASVLRATLMASIYLGVRLIDQRTAAANAVSLTAAIVLLASPLSIVDVGFWLTFGATIALLIGSGILTAGGGIAAGATGATGATGAAGATDAAGALRAFVARGLSALGRAAVAMVVATVCVELVLAPIAALVFQRVTLAGLLLNFAAIPAMTIVQIGAMAVVLCDLLGAASAAGALGLTVHAAAIVLSESARLLDLAPWLTWRVVAPDPMVIAAYYVALAATVAAALRFRDSTAGARVRPVRGPGGARVPMRVAVGFSVAAGCLFLWIVAAPQARIRARGDGRLHLTMIDVGQGDAALVTFPNGRTLLVDTGGASSGGGFDIGDRVIAPALRARGLLGLDYLAVTHGDPDHIGGAAAMVRDFTPTEIWWGVPVPGHVLTASLRADAARRRIAWRTLQRRDRVEIGGVELRVHHPPPPDWERQRVRNNDSLVIELRFGDVSMVLTGDIDREIERELETFIDPLPTVILKVAHHGSGTSSRQEFLASLRPRIAVIGVGRKNIYGHPVPPVLQRLRGVGAEIFRTDLDGEVEVATDGKDVEVTTFSGRVMRVAP